MQTLRNIFTSRTLNYLRQNGQNAIINATQQPPTVDAALPPPSDVDQKLKNARPSPFNIPRSILDACQFNTTTTPRPTGSLSPTTLKRFRRMQRRMELVYRCKLCNTRNTKTISEEAFYSGVVILQCDGCAVDHLIRDHLGLFTNSSDGSKNIEKLLSEPHERVHIIKVNERGQLI